MGPRILQDGKRLMKLIDLGLGERCVQSVFDIREVCVHAFDIQVGQARNALHKCCQFGQRYPLAMGSCLDFEMDARGRSCFRGRSRKDLRHILTVDNLAKFAGDYSGQPFNFRMSEDGDRFLDSEGTRVERFIQ